MNQQQPTLRYGTTLDPHLRFALWKAWGYTCYWCQEPRLLPAIQIDHIVPQNPNDLAKTLSMYSLPSDYDLHDPRNLAPICVNKCNITKGNKVDQGVGLIASYLKKATRLRDGVIKDALAISESGVVAETLMRVAQFDPSNPDDVALVVDYGPAAQAALASFRVDYVEQVLVEYELDDGDSDVPQSAILTHAMDAASRQAAGNLTTYCGLPVETLRKDLTIDLAGRTLEEALASSRTAETARVSDNDISRLHYDSLLITLDALLLDFSVAHASFVAKLSGTYQASLSGTATYQSLSGAHADSGPVSTAIAGTLSLSLYLEPGHGGAVTSATMMPTSLHLTWDQFDFQIDEDGPYEPFDLHSGWLQNDGSGSADAPP